MERKYVAMDVHFATTTSVVLNADGKQVMNTVLQTEAGAIRDYLKGITGPVFLTFEEGTMAAWLYEIVEPLAEKLVVCNPRQNSLLKSGSKSDKIDAAKLAELLRLEALKPVYHKRHKVGELKQLVAVYSDMTGDRTRVINRLRAVFRSESLRMTFEKKKREEMLARLASGLPAIANAAGSIGDPGGAAFGVGRDTASFSDKTAVLELLRVECGHQKHRRS